MKRLLIINGPNLNLLGKRKPEIYGNATFKDYLKELKENFENTQLDYFQSNVEGEIIDQIQLADGNSNGIIINAGGYTHTSVAIRDAIESVEIPVVEVHISNVAARESFRHTSFLTPVCVGVIAGFGMESYSLAIQYFINSTN
jgi:3-dehydroquinate dehydratase-2